ncbi:MAG: SdrD B-like domain-containing protein, partial [Xenococcaceae cyanobacterium MO_188.B29]|nr:SdrD B-like domain-containing protein [Xenococcaceae cyanobacterium MO_188.B29]
MATQTKSANSVSLSHTNQVQHLVFIDSNVSDYAYLAAGVIPGAEVIILEPNQDGIKQITQALNFYSYPVSLHIVSHGSPGCLYLGNSELSLDTLDNYKQDLKTWFSNPPLLGGEGQGERLLLYGCNVAAGDAGEEFIHKLHNLTSAEIAASTTPVGNAAKGGKWELDYQTKFIATPLIFEEEIQSNYTEVFADEKFSLGNRVWQDDNNNGQIDGSESGIDGVVVNLYEDIDNNGSPNGGIIATTTTADGGYYRFDNLNAGNYIVEVAASNFNTGNALNGLVSSGTEEAEPDNDIDANDNGVGIVPNPTNGIRSNTVTLGTGFSEPTGEDFVPPATTSTSIDLGQTETTGGNGTNVRINGVDSSNAGSTTGRITLEFEPERFIIDVAGFGNDLTGFCLEFAELASPDLNYTAVNATTTGPFYNSSYNDPGDIPNFYGPGDNPDPNSIPADYGIITQAELDIISTVWANVENTIVTNANDAAALQLLIWELQNDQTFDLTSGNFILDATGSSNSTVNANTSAAITTVNSWYTNATNGTWTGSVPLALLTVEDQQDIIVSFDLGVGATDTQSNLTVDFAFNDLIDYGDAPDTQSGSVAALDSSTLPDYQTTQADGGASHAIDSNLYMGSGVDPDDGTQQNPNADADDTVNSGLADDENGISFTTTDILTSDDTFLASVTATNNTASPATVVGWIDFDRSGTFDADEAVSTTIASGSTDVTKPLLWDNVGTDSTPIPDDITPGTTYARFRITTDPITTAASDSVSLFSNGEVEDYQVNILDTSLGDQVFIDSNNNGIKDTGEPGLSGVTVTLVGGGTDGLISTTGDNTTTTTTTNSSGNYSFTGLTPGVEYQVSFDKTSLPNDAEFITANVGSDQSVDSDANASGVTPIVTLTSGEKNQNIDAGIIQPASLGDAVFLDNDGDGIQDGSETGVSGVRVTLTGGGTDGLISTTGDNSTVTVATDASGNYSFSGLTPGAEYQVSFDNLPTGAEFTQADASTDETIDSDADASGVTPVITLTSGENNDSIDAGIYQPASLGDKVFFNTDGDGIQEGGELGVSGVRVTLTGGGADGLISTPGDNSTATTTTNSSGNYSFTRLTPGVEYQVTFDQTTLPGNYQFALANAGADETADSDADSSGVTSIVTLTSGENNETIDAGIVQPASLGDTVFLDSNGDGIIDGSETGVSGVRVTLTGGGTDNLISTTIDNSTTTVATDADGNYSFTGLTPGAEYQVSFDNLPTGAEFTIANASTDETIDSDADASGVTPIVTLSSGENNQTIAAGIYQPPSLGDKVFLDTDGDGIQDVGESGVSGVTVTLTGGGDDGLISTTGDNSTATVTTDSSGNYSFTGLTPGAEYQVSFDLPAGTEFTIANASTDET